MSWKKVKNSIIIINPHLHQLWVEEKTNEKCLRLCEECNNDNEKGLCLALASLVGQMEVVKVIFNMIFVLHWRNKKGKFMQNANTEVFDLT